MKVETQILRLYEGANVCTNPSDAIQRSDLGWLQFHFALAPVPEVAAQSKLFLLHVVLVSLDDIAFAVQESRYRMSALAQSLVQLI